MADIATPPRPEDIHHSGSPTPNVLARLKRSLDEMPGDAESENEDGHSPISSDDAGTSGYTGSSRRSAKRVRSNDGTAASHDRTPEARQVSVEEDIASPTGRAGGSASMTAATTSIMGEGTRIQIVASPPQRIPTLVTPYEPLSAHHRDAVPRSPLRNALTISDLEHREEARHAEEQGLGMLALRPVAADLPARFPSSSSLVASPPWRSPSNLAPNTQEQLGSPSRSPRSLQQRRGRSPSPFPSHVQSRIFNETLEPLRHSPTTFTFPLHTAESPPALPSVTIPEGEPRAGQRTSTTGTSSSNQSSAWRPWSFFDFRPRPSVDSEPPPPPPNPVLPPFTSYHCLPSANLPVTRSDLPGVNTTLSQSDPRYSTRGHSVLGSGQEVLHREERAPAQPLSSPPSSLQRSHWLDQEPNMMDIDSPPTSDLQSFANASSHLTRANLNLGPIQVPPPSNSTAPSPSTSASPRRLRTPSSAPAGRMSFILPSARRDQERVLRSWEEEGERELFSHPPVLGTPPFSLGLDELELRPPSPPRPLPPRRALRTDSVQGLDLATPREPRVARHTPDRHFHRYRRPLGRYLPNTDASEPGGSPPLTADHMLGGERHATELSPSHREQLLVSRILQSRRSRASDISNDFDSLPVTIDSTRRYVLEQPINGLRAPGTGSLSSPAPETPSSIRSMESRRRPTSLSSPGAEPFRRRHPVEDQLNHLAAAASVGHYSAISPGSWDYASAGYDRPEVSPLTPSHPLPAAPRLQARTLSIGDARIRTGYTPTSSRNNSLATGPAAVGSPAWNFTGGFVNRSALLSWGDQRPPIMSPLISGTGLPVGSTQSSSLPWRGWTSDAASSRASGHVSPSNRSQTDGEPRQRYRPPVSFAPVAPSSSGPPVQAFASSEGFPHPSRHQAGRGSSDDLDSARSSRIGEEMRQYVMDHARAALLRESSDEGLPFDGQLRRQGPSNAQVQRRELRRRLDARLPEFRSMLGMSSIHDEDYLPDLELPNSPPFRPRRSRQSTSDQLVAPTDGTRPFSALMAREEPEMLLSDDDEFGGPPWTLSGRAISPPPPLPPTPPSRARHSLASALENAHRLSPMPSHFDWHLDTVSEASRMRQQNRDARRRTSEIPRSQPFSARRPSVTFDSGPSTPPLPSRLQVNPDESPLNAESASGAFDVAGSRRPSSPSPSRSVQRDTDMTEAFLRVADRRRELTRRHLSSRSEMDDTDWLETATQPAPTASRIYNRISAIADVEQLWLQHLAETGFDSPIIGGLPVHLTSLLPTMPYKDSKEAQKEERCPICLDDYEQTDIVMGILECGHFFHKDCFHPWLKTSRTCPYCRQRINPKRPGANGSKRNGGPPPPSAGGSGASRSTRSWVYSP